LLALKANSFKEATLVLYFSDAQRCFTIAFKNYKKQKSVKLTFVIAVAAHLKIIAVDIARALQGQAPSPRASEQPPPKKRTLNPK
jgi:hypothetical protein